MRVARVWGLLLALALGVTAGTAQNAHAQPADQAKADEEARVHFRLGVAYHDSGRFADAAQEFEQAYELSQRPKLLYNLFLAYRDGGNIHKAADALERFLTLEKEVPEREKLEARLEALQRIIANRPPPAAQPEPEEEEEEQQEVAEAEPAPAEPAAPPPPQMERNPWHKYTPWVAMGTGVAMMGVGAAVGTIALSDYGDCEDGSCSESKLSSGTTKTRLADAMLFGGGVIAATGLVLYFVLPREREVPATTGGVACGPSGCGASLTHRF